MSANGPVTLTTGLIAIPSGGNLATTTNTAALNVNSGTLSVGGALSANGPVTLTTGLIAVPSGGNLTATNAAGISLNGGTLTVNGALASSSSVSVNGGATLTGTGAIPGAGSVVLAPGSLLAPDATTLANSVGTLAVGGLSTFGAARGPSAWTSPTVPRAPTT